MAGKLNGWTKWVIWIVGAIFIAGGMAVQLRANTGNIDTNEKGVESNKERIIKVETRLERLPLMDKKLDALLKFAAEKGHDGD